MPERVYVGIDNGVSGAISILYPGGAVKTFLTPLTNYGNCEIIDDLILRDILRSAGKNLFVAFEKSTKNPKFGVVGNFSGGWQGATIRTVLRQNAWDHLPVGAKEWQAVMHKGFRPKLVDTKTASFDACAHYFPDVSLIPPRCRTPHSGIADSLLIALWAKQKKL